MNINLEWYRIFMYTARSGSLTKAALSLHMTQPSVSYAIKQLEDALGVKLFDRRSKGVTVTSEGRSLLEYVESAFMALQSGEKKIHDMKRLEAGEIRIGASGAIMKHVIVPALDDFRSLHPQIRIQLVQGQTSEIAKKLKDGRIDAGFIHLPFIDNELDIIPVLSTQHCFVVGEPYRKLAEQPISTGQLATIPLLAHTPGSSTRKLVEQWFMNDGFFIKPDFELNSVDMLLELAERGYGCAFVARSFVQRQIEAGTLFVLETISPIPPSGIGIATLRETSLSLASSAFVEIVRQKQE